MTRFPRCPALAALSIASAGLLAGCSGGSGGDGGTGPNPTPSITVTVSPGSLQIQQGENGAVTVTVTGSGGFSSTATITATGVPSGVSASVGGVSSSGSTTTGTVTVSATAGATPGTYTITVHASGSGVSEVTRTFSLTITATPAYALSLAPPSLTIDQGASSPATVTIDRTNFTGAVTLSLTGAPSGVTGSFSPSAPTGTSSTLTLAVGSSVAAGTYHLTVHGQATGAANQSAALDLTVNAVVQGNYSLTTNPVGSITMNQGASANVTIDVIRTGGFADAVNLTVTGVPSGLTANINPSSTTGTATAMLLMASSGLAAGDYPLVVHGTATGLPDKSANFTVTIAVPTGPVVLDYAACPTEEKPIWFAMSDGGGAWTQVTPTGDSYSVNFIQSKGAIAWTTVGLANDHYTHVSYMSVAEFRTMAAGSLCTPGGKTVTGSFTNLPGGTHALVSLGSTVAFASPLGAFQLHNVASGPQDFVTWASAAFTPAAGDHVLIRRDIDVPDMTSIAPIDATSSEWFSPVTANITVDGSVSGESLLAAMGLTTRPSCTTEQLWSGVNAPSGVVAAFGIPPAHLNAGDLHALTVQGIKGADSYRSITSYFHTLGLRHVAMPSELPLPAVTTLGGPYKRLNVQVGVPGDITGTFTFSYTSTFETMAITVSQLGFIGSSAINIGVPDFSAIGYTAAWAPASGASVTWVASASAAGFLGSCVEGGSFVSATRTGNVP